MSDGGSFANSLSGASQPVILQGNQEAMMKVNLDRLQFGKLACIIVVLH